MHFIRWQDSTTTSTLYMILICYRIQYQTLLSTIISTSVWNPIEALTPSRKLIKDMRDWSSDEKISCTNLLVATPDLNFLKM